MRPQKTVVCALLAFVLCYTSTFGSASPTPSSTTPVAVSVARAIEKIKPSVVYVRSMIPCRHDGLHAYDEASGTGVIVKLNGDTYVLTNNHVVYKAGVVQIRVNDIDHAYVPAIVVGKSREPDMAILKAHFQGDAVGKRPAVIASMPAPVGTQVVKAGYPGLVDSALPTFAAGIVSNTEACIGHFAIPYGVTDAQISRGDSGGPLFNLRGEVIGINTVLSISEVTIGHYIPANVIAAMIPRLFRGDVKKGWLGMTSDHLVSLRHIAGGRYQYGEMHGNEYHISYNAHTRVVDVQTYTYIQTPFGSLMNLKEAYAIPLFNLGGGILVVDTSLWADVVSPFKRGDIIISFNGRFPKDGRELFRWISETDPGQRVPVTLRRDGILRQFTVTIAEYDWNWRPPNE